MHPSLLFQTHSFLFRLLCSFGGNHYYLFSLIYNWFRDWEHPRKKINGILFGRHTQDIAICSRAGHLYSVLPLAKRLRSRIGKASSITPNINLTNQKTVTRTKTKTKTNVNTKTVICILDYLPQKGSGQGLGCSPWKGRQSHPISIWPTKRQWQGQRQRQRLRQM